MKEKDLILLLTAEDRTKLRGMRKTICGCNVLLQLPRGQFLRPGEILTDNDSNRKVEIKAAKEDLLLIESNSKLQLLQAAYHLGNRHVDIEIEENSLFIKIDPVLQKLLKNRTLSVKKCKKEFFPEMGAYSYNHHKHL